MVEAEVDASYWVWLEEQLYTLRGKSWCVSVLSSGTNREDNAIQRNPWPPWGAHLWEHSQAVASTHTTLNCRSENSEIHGIFCFWNSGSLTSKKELHWKKTIKNNWETARWNCPRRCSLRRRGERRRASVLWEGGAPSWITLPKMQIRPNVFIVGYICIWWPLYLEMALCISFLSDCLQSLSNNVSSCLRKAWFASNPLGIFAWIDTVQTTSGKVGVCPMKIEIHLAKIYGSEISKTCVVHDLSS